jgi:hypothetical protein
MKKILLILLTVISLGSCTRDENLATNISTYPKGGYARFSGGTAVKLAKAVTDAQGVVVGNYKATIIDPNGNGSQYKIYKMDATIAGVVYNDIPLNYTYSFPANLDIPISDLAVAAGASASDIYYGDSFTFYAQVTTSDGKVFTPDAPDATILPTDSSPTNFSIRDLTNSNYYPQAMKFDVAVACNGFVIADLVGNYNIANDDWGNGYPAAVTIIAGPATNEITIQNFDGNGDNLIVGFDSDGNATVSSQSAEPFSTYTGHRVAGTGFSLSCTGFISLDLKHSVSVGTFSTIFNLSYQKN